MSRFGAATFAVARQLLLPFAGMGGATDLEGFRTVCYQAPFLQGEFFMSRRSRLIGLAIAAALLANGFATKASADNGACQPVKACAPVKTLPAVPVCKPVRQLPLPGACKPVKPLPLPEACKPVKACDAVDAHHKYYAVLQDRVARFARHFKKHSSGTEVYYDAPQPAPTQASPALPPAPAPAPPSAPRSPAA